MLKQDSAITEAYIHLPAQVSHTTSDWVYRDGLLATIETENVAVSIFALLNVNL